MSLVTHVSSDQGCRYFHQPRPLGLGTQLTHGAQHSLGAKEQRTFLLAHFHVLRKFRQRWEQIKHSSQLSQHISCLSGDVCLVSALTQPGSGSAQWHRTGKLIPGLGCPNLFLGQVFARLESSSTPLPRSHHYHLDTDPLLLISEGFLSQFSPCCLHQACWWCQGMNESFLILRGGESFREWQCIV